MRPSDPIDHTSARPPARPGSAPAPSTPGWATALRQAWLGRGALARALWPLSLLYAGLAGARRWLYRSGLRRSMRVGMPVIVVGNVVVGGAGKTPVVMALVQHLQQQGWRPGVISRGYGRRTTDCREVRPDSPPEEVGDEPLLIRQRCGVPVFVARARVQAARALRAAHPEVDVLVADDGLQHHALERDIDIAVFDDRGLGNGWLLPAGPLREHWPRRTDTRPGRGAAQLLLHTGSHPAFAGHRSSRRLADHAVDSQGRRTPLASLRGQRVMAIAGIARPEAFFGMLAEQGLALEEAWALRDHHDLAGLDLPQDPQLTLLCTEKDAVKLFARHRGAGVRLLAVPLAFSPEPAFLSALDRLLAQACAAMGYPLPSPHGHTTS